MSDNKTDTPRNSFIVLILFIVLFIISSVIVGCFVWHIPLIDERVKNETEALKTTATIFGAIAVFINAYYAAKRAEAMDKSAEAANKSAEAALRNAEAAQDKQITERFAKAIEQLGNEKIEVRLGAIYTLERIAKDSKDDHWTIMEVLTAFVRENAPLMDFSEKNTGNSDSLIIVNTWNYQKPKEIEQEPKLQTDIQAALTVIGRRKSENDPENQRLDLCNIDIRGADLREAKLQKADLREANLQGAELTKANLQGADIFGANLQEANLRQANLEGAKLIGINLRKANLEFANLQGADLILANLQEVFLRESNLQGANLRQSNLRGANLNGSNLREVFLEKANLEEVFLMRANLREAFFEKANLQKAFLMGANLQGADLTEANLQEAIIREANLQGAILRGVKNLEQHQIELAKGDRTTILPENLQFPECW
ncbi:pentapeptide repeat-containing protein [Nostoc sp. KVJ3]|uniref:pentapeptide repeat-containing protein n=1 Tax=Nostoc sp. KVJ3 TaxID=457945 RepID=UPI0022387B5B|nr:pentapeptide repeat-containing protein [Nostoc sp. KVJ3]MCW5317397.1 pentapeptide repeat-containing protein [Nostoc sp. KVJ3]